MADGEDRLHAEVLTPEGKVFDGELFQISTRTVVGELGVRARHAPVLARLVPHELRLYEDESDFGSSEKARRYAAGEGWLEVFANKAIVLLGEAIDPETLDASDQRAKLEDAERRMAESEEDSAAHRAAEQDRDRAQAFLELAEGRGAG